MRFALLLVLVVGCIPAPVYRVQRTARVPRTVAPLRSGAPLEGPIELSVGATAGGESRLGDHAAALEVPRQQTRTELRMRIGRGEIAPFYEQAIKSSIDSLDATQAPVGSGVPNAVGLATRYSFATGVPGLSVGTAVEALMWSIPYVEYRTCVDHCEENGVSGTQVISSYESIGTVAFGMTPTYQTGRVVLFAGAYVRRQPTIERKGTEIGVENDRDISAGNFNWMLHAGIEVRASVFSLLASVQQDMTRDAILYGPSVGVAIAVHLPDLAPRRTPPPVEPRVPWYARSSPQPEQDDDNDATLPDDPW